MNLLIVPLFSSALDIGIYPLCHPKYIFCIHMKRKMRMTLTNTNGVGGEGGRLKGNPFFIILLKANVLCTVLSSGLRCEQRTYS